MFTARFARHRARRYRRRGPDATAQTMVDFAARDIEGAHVLEIGGGVGEVHLELLRRGASRATSLELSPAYEDEASRLLAETGLTDRVDRQIVDIAVHPDAVEPADVVVLHRVVCCYPDYAGLLAAAADHARRSVVFSYPRRAVPTRAVVAAQNAVFAMRRKEFRVFVHAPDDMDTVLAAHRHDVVFRHRAPIWQVAGTARSAELPSALG